MLLRFVSRVVYSDIFSLRPYISPCTGSESAMADNATVACSTDGDTTVPPPVPSETEKTAEAEKGEKTYSADELGKHTTDESCWIAIEGTVYDVTKVKAHILINICSALLLIAKH